MNQFLEVLAVFRDYAAKGFTFLTDQPNRLVYALLALAIIILLTVYSCESKAHGFEIVPVVTPPAAVVPPAAPAAAPANTGSFNPFPAYVLIGGVAIFIGYCLATEDKDYCKREDDGSPFPK